MLQELDQLDKAVKSYEKALAIKPDYAEAHNNLGIAFKDLAQLDAAVKCYEQALAIKPDYAEAHNNLGNAFKDLAQLDAAVKSYMEVSRYSSQTILRLINHLGLMLLRDLGQLDACG